MTGWDRPTEPDDGSLVAYGWAPGDYIQTCVCGTQHIAAKRASRCLPCARRLADKAAAARTAALAAAADVPEDELDDPTGFFALRRRLARAMCAAAGKDPDKTYEEFHRNLVDEDGTMGRFTVRRLWQDHADEAGRALSCLADAGLAVVEADAAAGG